MNACCKKHKTQFCPDCGLLLAANPANALLQHCRVSLSHQQKILEKGKLFLLKQPDVAVSRHSFLTKRVTRITKVVAKWQSWVDALEKIMETDGDCDASQGLLDSLVQIVRFLEAGDRFDATNPVASIGDMYGTDLAVPYHNAINAIARAKESP